MVIKEHLYVKYAIKHISVMPHYILMQKTSIKHWPKSLKSLDQLKKSSNPSPESRNKKINSINIKPWRASLNNLNTKLSKPIMVQMPLRD